MVFYLVLSEDTSDLTCKEFLERENLLECFNPTHHNVLYSLHKKELISDKKVIVAQHVASDKWTYSSHASRAILGLPLTGDVTLTPEGIKKGYRLFVQSTSWNRKIRAGTHVIVEVTKEQFEKFSDPDCTDTRMEHITVSIGTDTSAKPAVEYTATFAHDNTTLKETFAERLSNKKATKSPKKSPKRSPPTKKAASKRLPRKTIEKKKLTTKTAPKRLQRANTMLATAKEGEEFVRLMEIKERKLAMKQRRAAQKL